MVSRITKGLLINAAVAIAMFVVCPKSQAAATDCSYPAHDTVGSNPQYDPLYNGRPLSSWLRSIQNRDEDLDDAFDAIEQLGPLAWPAVPLLNRIVAAPFMPVRAGEDDNEEILPKLMEIQFRSNAVDALGAIGEAAACSTGTLIDWALTARVTPVNEAAVNGSIFAMLVGIDVFERMRVSGAIAGFGPAALPTLLPVLTSSNGERRKLAVSILSERAVPLIVELLRSTDCSDKKLGLAMLIDLWPVASRTHLELLKDNVACEGN